MDTGARRVQNGTPLQTALSPGLLGSPGCPVEARESQPRIETLKKLEVQPGRTENSTVQRTSPSTMTTTRRQRSVRLALRGVGFATISALTLTAVPAVVTASPAALQAPALPQALVGLSQGATGADVVALQNALIAAGVTVPGGADGVFGPATKSALTAYQSRSGLATSGTLDNPTATALGLIAPASAASGALAVGAQGDGVKELQNALMAFGVFVPGGADGVFGPATKTAVSNFQRWNGLAVTGEADAATASKLKLGSTPSAAPAGVAGPTAPAASSPSAGFVGMTTGARGDNVKVLQRALIAAGITVRGGADGVFGPMTAAALTSYQQANGLTANGIVDDGVVAGLAPRRWCPRRDARASSRSRSRARSLVRGAHRRLERAAGQGSPTGADAGRPHAARRRRRCVRQHDPHDVDAVPAVTGPRAERNRRRRRCGCALPRIERCPAGRQQPRGFRRVR